MSQNDSLDSAQDDSDRVNKSISGREIKAYMKHSSETQVKPSLLISPYSQLLQMGNSVLY